MPSSNPTKATTYRNRAVGVSLIFILGCSGIASLSRVNPPTSNQAPGTAPICNPGDKIDCASLAGIWVGGTSAMCKDSGLAYDVSTCLRTGGATERIQETVYPAQRDLRWQNAKCNHAGDFVFEISMAPLPRAGQPPNPWVISLEGGGSCASNDTKAHNGCVDRDRVLVEPYKSGKIPYPKDRTTAVVPAIVDLDFSNSNWVNAHYCSSDGWTGSNTGGIPVTWSVDGSTRNWPFTGHYNIQSLLDILEERYGLDDQQPGMSIHFRGDSAGGWGVFNNAYLIKEHFPNIARSGNLLLSPWAGFIPPNWSNPNFPSYQIYPTWLQAIGAFTTTWKSVLTPACIAAHPDAPHQCMSGDALYDLITAPEPTGLDLPVLVYQNRQDQLYMGLMGLPPVSSSLSADQVAGRSDFIAMLNTGMGTTSGVPNVSKRMNWLYAPSDPVVAYPNGTLEENVHPPQDYLINPPGGDVSQSLQNVTSRFWRSRGKGPGRGRMPGEVHTFNCNWYPDHLCP